MSTSAPTNISFGNYVMRRLRMEDVDLFMAMVEKPESRELAPYMNWMETVVFIQENSHSSEAAELRMREIFSRFVWRLVHGSYNGKHIAYLIFSEDDPSAIKGEVGIWPADPGRPNVYEIGYWVYPSVQRQGVATQAVDKILEFGFDVLNAEEIVAVVDPSNEPSVAFIERIAKSSRLVENRLQFGGSFPTPSTAYEFSLERSIRNIDAS